MPKYRPERKGKLERKVKELDSKTRDRTNHMSNVVKNDAKAIADLSKKIRQGATIEGAKATKEAQQQAGGEVKKEYGRQKKSLEGIVKKGGKTERELEERGKYSKLNYAELTKASNSTKETPAAKRGLDQGKQATQKEIDIMKAVESTLRGIRQHIQDMSYELEPTKDLGILLGERDGKSDWAEFSLNPQEVKDVLEEHQMDIELRGPVLAKDRGKSERIK